MWLMGQYGVAAVTKYACFMTLVVAADAASLEMKGSFPDVTVELLLLEN